MIFGNIMDLLNFFEKFQLLKAIEIPGGNCMENEELLSNLTWNYLITQEIRRLQTRLAVKSTPLGLTEARDRNSTSHTRVLLVRQ